MEYVKKRGARLFVAAGQPQGVGDSRGARITQGGKMPPPRPPLNIPLPVKNLVARSTIVTLRARTTYVVATVTGKWLL